MKYSFPIITHFDDIKDAIDANYFMVADRGDHKIVNYLFASLETFPSVTSEHDAMKREFRGLIFDNDGNLIRRPYHKFFNVGERAETSLQDIDVSQPHVILEKLDGSMIAPFEIDGTIYPGTKMGYTDVAKQVEYFLEYNSHYINFIDTMLISGYTPIFEWCSRAQQIVLDYKEPRLVLTGIRDMKTGQYMSYEDMVILINGCGIDYVKAIPGTLNDQFVDFVKQNEDPIEGFVIRFEDGHMVKIKSDLYCQLHRVKSDIQYERGVIELILNDKIDDIKALLPAEEKEAIKNYERSFWQALETKMMEIAATINHHTANGISRKDFAINRAPQLESWVSGIVFKLFDKTVDRADVYPLVRDAILKNCTRNSKFDEFRKSSLFDKIPEWRGKVIEDD